MENLLIVPRSDDEFSFLKELLDKLNIRTQVITNEEYKLLGYKVNYDEPSNSVLLQMSATSLLDVWENEDSEVWNSYLTDNELKNV